MLWDTIKQPIWGLTISYSATKRKKFKARIEDLELRIFHARKERSKTLNKETTGTIPVLLQIQNRIEQLEKELGQEYQGKHIKHRVEKNQIFYEKYERCSKEFFSWGSSKNRHPIRRIRKPMGATVGNDQNILKEFYDFYKQLYSKQKIDLGVLPNFVKVQNIPKIFEEESEEMKKEITMDELTTAVKSMEGGKSPGSDGFTVEFYKKFWEELSNHMINGFQCLFKKGKMGITQKKGMITLIPKTGKDTTYVSNWRPITLLNVDYKIISKAIANRIKIVLPKLIHPDQKGFVPGRFIGENMMDLYKIMETYETRHKRGILLSVDFYKAFDTIDRDYVAEILEAYVFPEYIIYNGLKPCFFIWKVMLLQMDIYQRILK